MKKILLTLMVLLSSFSYASELERIKKEGKIVLAVRNDSFPFAYVDGTDALPGSTIYQNNPIGYSIDICNKLVESIKKEVQQPNLKVEYLTIDASQRIKSVVSGKASIECGVTTNTKERRDNVEFTIPHFVSSVKFLSLSKDNLTEIDQLLNSTVVVIKGSTELILMKKINTQILGKMNILEVQSNEEAVSYLRNNKAKAYINNDIFLYEAKALNPKEFSISNKTLEIEPYSLMIAKSDKDFKKFIDTEMIKLMKSGEITKLYSKWFLEPVAPNKINLNLTMSPLMKEMIKYPSDKVFDSF